MDEPRVTFIIAHHNYQQYLKEAIDSAVNQNYNNIHICVIDDCSEDQNSVREILEDFTTWSSQTYENGGSVFKSEQFTYIELVHSGLGSYKQAYARNRGIEACWNDSDFFAILDADDMNYAGKISACLKPMLEYPDEIGGVYADTIICNYQTGNTVREYREPFDAFRLIQECIVHSGCVLSKKALEQVLENGVVFDESLPPVEDYDLWVRLAEKFLLVHLPLPLTYVRVHKQNSTNTTTHEHRMNMLRRLHEKRLARQQQ